MEEKNGLIVVEGNPDFAQYVEANGGYCPCAVDRSEDTLCPCKDFREQDEPGECLCGRYTKIRSAFAQSPIEHD